jgi:Fe-S cluster biogenesis protein NfuA
MVASNEWPQGDVEERVRYAVEEVRPAIQADGGDVSLVGIAGGVVRVELHGACKDCAMASSTLADFVAERIRLYAPEISEVVACQAKKTHPESGG